MNAEELASDRHREVVELLERIAHAVERPAPPVTLAPTITRCCPFCLRSWQGGLDEPCPSCGGRGVGTVASVASGGASCTCGCDCDGKTP